MADTKLTGLEITTTPSKADYLYLVKNPASAISRGASVSTFSVIWLEKTGGAMSGSIGLADNLLTRPVFQDYAEEGVDLGNSGSDITFNFESGNDQSVTLTASATFDFSNPPPSPSRGSMTLEINNPSNLATSWAAPVQWPDGLAPGLSGICLLTFRTRDGGTTYQGFLAGKEIA
jgi:hypothetical protein